MTGNDYCYEQWEQTAQVQKSLAPSLGEKKCSKSTCSKSLWPAIRTLLKKTQIIQIIWAGENFTVKRMNYKSTRKMSLLSKTPLPQKAKLLTKTNEALQGSFKEAHFRIS